MSVWIVIPAALTCVMLAMGFFMFLPSMYQICNTNSWWSSNSTTSPHYNGNVATDKTRCNNSINTIFLAFVGAMGAIIIWAFAKTGQKDQNWG